MTDSPWKLPQEESIKLDAGLRQLINGIPGEAPLAKILTLAHIGSIEKLEALGSIAFWGANGDQRSDPEVVADKVLKLAKACEPQAYKEEIASVEHETKAEIISFWTTWGGSMIDLATASRRARSPGILHEGQSSDIHILRAGPTPAVTPESALGCDHK